MNNVQAFVLNLTVPKSLEQFVYHVLERGEYVLDASLDDEELGEWTAPRWAKIGDIAFLMHAKYADTHLRKVARQLAESRDEYTQEEYDEAMRFLQHGFDLHKKYGGKIYAMAQITGAPEYFDDETADDLHYWKSRLYAYMSSKYLLEHPVDISEFREFLYISRQSSITPVIGDTFDQLRDLIISRGNTVPSYFLEAKAAPLPLSAIGKDNWLTLCYDWRNRFFLEQQFRKFYVDYFLRDLSDDGRLYSECRVKKSGTNPRVDNVILFKGKYLPVEVKLNIDNEPDLPGQLDQYCCGEVFLRQKAKALSSDKVYAKCVLVIDTEGLYLYSYGSSSLTLICPLSEVIYIGDIQRIREALALSV